MKDFAPHMLSLSLRQAHEHSFRNAKVAQVVVQGLEELQNTS